MANLEADKLFTEQWNRMLEGGGNHQGWGRPEPTRAMMNGKQQSDLLNWSLSCKKKVAYWIGRIPDDQSKNDGWAEVRALWFHRRAVFLEEQAETMQWQPPTQSISVIQPMPVDRLPFGARPAFITKRARQEEEDANGTGNLKQEEDSVLEPSPSVTPLDASLTRPFKPPRKKARVDLGEIPETPVRILAEVDLTCPEKMTEEEDQLLENNHDSSDSEEE